MGFTFAIERRFLFCVVLQTYGQGFDPDFGSTLFKERVVLLVFFSCTEDMDDDQTVCNDLETLHTRFAGFGC